MEFDTSQWFVDFVVENAPAGPYVRSGFSLKELARHTVAGTSVAKTMTVLDSKNAEKLTEIINEVNQPARSAKLIMENGRANEFEPGQKGQTADVHALLEAIRSGEQKIVLPVVFTRPSVSLAETNGLGINELVAVGESDFSGSPRNRIHNIRVGADRYQGLILKPGEQFSFNKFLGDVDAAHGFLPELVIKREGLVPEFGGGLCQVSSTAFRAAMNAGLPIDERRNHSFAVRYYAPQGTDATIYPGVVDLKFTNNFPGHLLIRTKVSGNKLYFEFYGTKDGRRVAFDGPTSYDFKPDGSLKSVWNRTVTLNNIDSEQTFRSTYVSPNLFKKEATVESDIPNPETAEPEETPNDEPAEISE